MYMHKYLGNRIVTNVQHSIVFDSASAEQKHRALETYLDLAGRLQGGSTM